MTKVIFILGLCSLLAAPNSWAEGYYCTKTHRLVSTGMSIEEVLQACGEPADTKTLTLQPVVERLILVQWIYSSKQVQAPWSNTLAPELQISFYQGQVQSIEVDGSAGARAINCFGKGTIELGDSTDKVAMVCGQPDSYQKKRKTLRGPLQIKRILTYTRPNQLEPVILEFDGNKLQAIRFGQV